MGAFKTFLLLFLPLALYVGLIHGIDCPADTPTEWPEALTLGLNTTLFPFNLTEASKTNLSYNYYFHREFSLSSTIRIFDEDYTEMWIGLNGYISFGGRYYGGGKFALSTRIQEEERQELFDVPALLVYYCPESYAEANAFVYYDEITEDEQLCRFANYLQGTDPPAAPPDFKPTSLQVVTWYNTTCGYYYDYYNEEQVQAQNLQPGGPGSYEGQFYQGVIGSNGTTTFVCYIYGIIPDSEYMGSMENFVFAEVGYDRFNPIVKERCIPEAGISAIARVLGNYGDLAKNTYQIDGKMYSPPDCMEGPLTVNDRYALQCGGKRIFIFGPCYYNDPDVKCNFGGILVDAVILNNSTAYCITPFIAVYGYINLTVSLDGGSTYDYAVDFYIIGYDYRYQVDRIDPDGAWLIAPYDDDLTIQWRSATLDSVLVNIDIVEITDAGTIGDVIRLKSGVNNADGELTLSNMLTEDSAVEKFLLFCSIRITSADEPPEEALWSDHHPCLWFDARLFLKIFLDNSPSSISSIITEVITTTVNLESIATNLRTLLSRTIGPGECNEWVNYENNNPLDLSNIRVPPCTEAQARADWRWWQTCSGISCQFYHEGASVCYTSWWPLPSQNVCYNATGSIILEGANGGGRVTREFRWWFQTFYHIQNDLLPFVACCKASFSCDQYYTRRPTSDCSGYVPPRPTWTGCDPHFITFDGRPYTFNGWGEYKLIENSNFKVQIRTAGFPLALDRGTSIVGLAVRKGSTSSIVEVLLGQPLIVKVGGAEQNLTGFINSVFSTPDNSVSVLLLSDDELELRFPQESACDGEVVRVRQAFDILQVSTLIPDCYKGQVKGLQGNFDDDATNEFERPSGLIISDSSSPDNIHDLFGEYWRVDREDSLFSYGDESYDQLNDPLYRPLFFTDSELLSTPNGGFCNDNLHCLYDFRVTGSTEFATGTMEATKEIMEIFELFQSTSNPCLSNPCVSGGECTPMSTPSLLIYVCTCPPGYGGVNCEEERCNPTPCQNSGTCIPDTSDDRYRCACRLGYTGTNCEIVACDPNPCENGGTCTPDTSNVRYSCDCTVGYVGTNCSMEDSATRCPRSVCINSTQCLFIDGEYTCICQAGYTGRFCEQEITPCDSVQCLNGGTCNSETGYVCQCHPSYTGSQCETAFCKSNPCQNDAACREDQKGIPHCTCQPGFTGLHCHITEDDLREKLIISLVPVAVLTVILLIIMAIILVARGVWCPVLSPLLAQAGNPQPVGPVKFGVRHRFAVKPRVRPALRQGPVYARPIMFNAQTFGPPRNISYA